MKKWIVADFETDPFQYRVKPEVFLSGFCDGTKCVQFWGNDAIQQFVDYLSQLREPHYIFFHNGGKFDFFFLPWPLGNPLRIINGRIVSARLPPLHRHTLRDSFAFLPFALSAYKKTEIDYDKFKRDNREQHKAEIMQYHRDDMVNLYELVKAFIDRFGLRLTIAGTAIRELNKYHPVERKGETHDEKFRSYYHGGRVQCFERGQLRGNWKLFDVNSMYPFVMAHRSHPIGKEYEFTVDLQRLIRPDSIGFATVDASSDGAFPFKANDGALEFPRTRGIFRITLFELRKALDLGLAEIHNIEEAYIARQVSDFSEFVRVFSAEKIAAKESGDKIGELFSKLMLNSAYGKFGANPENYYDYQFLLESDPFPVGWDVFEDWGWLVVIRRPAPTRHASFYDVATAASITGAARAELLDAIHNSKRVIYCDTDSIICESFAGRCGKNLGEWKQECDADTAIIIEKKLYALLSHNRKHFTKETLKNFPLIKAANKGVQMQLKDFKSVVSGEVYNYKRDAPTFKRDASVTFINRNIKMKG